MSDVARICVGVNKWALIDIEYWSDVHIMGTWCINSNGYACKTTKGRIIYLHKFIYKLINPNYTGEVDHKNMDTLNNLKENLRPSTRSQNMANTTLRSTNTSGVKGVYWHDSRHKWRARIKVNYKSIHLGYFDSLEEAKAVREAAAIRYFGEFAREN